MNDQTLDLRIKINRARVNLMFIIILSIANVFFICTGSSTRLPYASAISRLSIELAIQTAIETGNSALQILGLITGCLVLLAFTICYFLSKTKPKFFIIALSLIIADTFALIIFSFGNNVLGDIYVLLDIFVHFLSILYTVKAIKASAELELFKNASQNEHNLPPINTEILNTANAHNEFNQSNEEDETETLSQPIGKYIDNGTEPIVSGSHNGLDVFVVIEDGNAKLVINGYICDELEVSDYYEYQLRAFVNDIDFTFEYKRSTSGIAMYLYADDTLLDSLGIS